MSRRCRCCGLPSRAGTRLLTLAALVTYAQAWQGIHAEGGIWASLFGLLLWPALFDGSVPGAFVHAFQMAPLDLGTDGFWRARAGAIEVRLQVQRSRCSGGEGGTGSQRHKLTGSSSRMPGTAVRVAIAQRPRVSREIIVTLYL